MGGGGGGGGGGCNESGRDKSKVEPNFVSEEHCGGKRKV